MALIYIIIHCSGTVQWICLKTELSRQPSLSDNDSKGKGHKHSHCRGSHYSKNKLIPYKLGPILSHLILQTAELFRLQVTSSLPRKHWNEVHRTKLLQWLHNTKSVPCSSLLALSSPQRGFAHRAEQQEALSGHKRASKMLHMAYFSCLQGVSLEEGCIKSQGCYRPTVHI